MWSNQQFGAGIGRRPGGVVGPGGRTRAGHISFNDYSERAAGDGERTLLQNTLKELRGRRRKLTRRAPTPLPPPGDSSSDDAGEYSDTEEEERFLRPAEEYGTTTADSALETPAEDGFVSSVSQNSGQTRRKRPELVAVRLAKFVGKDVKEMFANLESTSRSRERIDGPEIAMQENTGTTVLGH